MATTRRFQWSPRQWTLRGLLIVVSLVCLALGLVAALVLEPARRQCVAVEHLERLGAQTLWWMADANESGRWRRVREWFPRRFFDKPDRLYVPASATMTSDDATRILDEAPRLEFVSFIQGGVDDRWLAALPKLPRLRSLNLHGSDVTSVGLRRLADFPRLQSLDLFLAEQIDDGAVAEAVKLPELELLDLGHTQVTDAGAALIGSMTRLKELRLSGTRITDAGLKSLERLTTLTLLDVDETAVTESACDDFQINVPGCVVAR